MDTLDRLIRNLKRLDASGRAGIIDDDDGHAQKLYWAEFGIRRKKPETKGAEENDVDKDDEGSARDHARPTVSVAYELLETSVNDRIDIGVDRVVADSARGSSSTGQDIIDMEVKRLASGIVVAIKSNTPPALAEPTIAGRQRRGNSSTDTLVDTGKMRDAVRSETKPGAQGWGDSK